MPRFSAIFRAFLEKDPIRDMIYEHSPVAKLRWKRPEICPSCVGEGEVDWKFTGRGVEQMTCSRCNGGGKRIPILEEIHKEMLERNAKEEINGN